MDKDKLRRFETLTYEDFRRLATDPSLSLHEKVGFPDSYRAGKEDAIFRDIVAKLTNLARTSRTVLDIGPGCSGLARTIVRHCGEQGSRLVLVDSQEMLAQLPGPPHVVKHAGRFPACAPQLAEYRGRIDALIVYSVLHYIFAEDNVWRFLDECLALLAPGGQLLLADIPNVSKRRRFFSSAAGAAFHKAFTGDDAPPPATLNALEPDKIDDAVVIGLLLRARGAGFDAYVVPQPPDLPMANRREDLLVVRP